MIIFITEANRHKYSGVVYGQSKITEVYDYLKRKRKQKLYVAKDYETNGLDPYKNDALLLAIGDEEIQYVIDCTTIDLSGLKEFHSVKWLGQNIKFDASFSKTKYNMLCTNLYDTQIADQKIFQNCGYSPAKNPNGYRWGLNAIIQRHLGFTPKETDKRIRESFIGANPNTIIYDNRHIEYVAGDIGYLHRVFKKQLEIADKYNLTWWLLNVEFPLISVLMEAELEGFYFDAESWKKIIQDNEEKQFEYECQLDNEIRKLRDTLLDDESRKYLTGGKFDRKRTKKPKLQTVGLFGEMDEFSFYSAKGFGVGRNKKSRSIKMPKPKGNIDWNSTDTLLDLFARLQVHLPLQGQAGRELGYLIPVLNPKTGKPNKRYGKRSIDSEIIEVPNYNQKNEGWTTDKKAFQKYLVDLPNSPMRNFIGLYNKFSRAVTEISNFGTNYLNKVNSVTNRIHTIYRQMFTVNGRLQSGGGRKQNDRYNSQNIPRDEKFRHCFKGGKYKDNKGREKWYSVVTCDLSGAEVTFMCDKAHDEKLYQWAVINDDSHSPMVQNVWRHIFLYRAGLAAGSWKNAKEFIKRHKTEASINKIKKSNNPDVVKWYDKSLNFIVSKKHNKPFRVAGKNGTFGGIYGMKAKKAQETFNNTDAELAKTGEEFEPVNVTFQEGLIILYAQRNAIPKTFQMVEDNVKLGFANGYIILNERSKSRIWLPQIISVLREIKKQYGKAVQIGITSKNDFYLPEYNETFELDFRYKKDYDGQLRNVPISGTQADCLKEAMVEIQDYIRNNEIDCQLLSQVHDELVYRCPKNMDGQSNEWQENPNTCYFEFDDKTMTKDYYMENFHEENHVVCYTNGSNPTEEPYMLSANVSFPKFVQLTMIQCANRYLKHYKMKADFEVKDSWTK